MRWIIGRGVAGGVLITAGGLCYSRVPTPSWVTRAPFLHHFRHTSQHLTVGLLLGIAGLVLLTWAWLGLRRYAEDEQTGVRAVRKAVAWWSVPLLLAPPLFSGDGWSYVSTGILTGRGFSPYVFAPSVLPPELHSAVNPAWQHTPTPYGPLALVWGGAASHLTSDPWALLVVYRLMAIAGVVLLAWATPKLARRCGQPAGTASWLVIASPFMVAHGIGGLHNDLPMVALGVAAIALTTRGVWIWGALLAGAAASVKIPGGLVAVGVVLLSLEAGAGYVARIVRAIQVGAVAGGTVLGLGWITGLGTGWISALSVPTSIPTKLAPMHEIGHWLTHTAHSLGLLQHHSVTHTVENLGMPLLAIAGAALVLRFPVGDDTRVIRAIGFLLFAATLLSPVVHYWYFFWGLPLLCCVPLPEPVRHALAAFLIALGLTAVADPSLEVPLLPPAARLSLMLAPLLAAVASVVAARRDAARDAELDALLLELPEEVSEDAGRT